MNSSPSFSLYDLAGKCLLTLALSLAITGCDKHPQTVLKIQALHEQNDAGQQEMLTMAKEYTEMSNAMIALGKDPNERKSKAVRETDPVVLRVSVDRLAKEQKVLEEKVVALRSEVARYKAVAAP